MSLTLGQEAGGAALFLGTIIVAVLVILDLSLLKAKKLSGSIWLGPLLSLYALATVLLSLALAVNPGSYGALSAYDTYFICAILGMGLGLYIGDHIRLSREEGAVKYTGGRLLVIVLLLLMLPRLVEQAAFLVTLFGGNASFSTSFAFLDVLTGALFFLGAFLSIFWRWSVWERRHKVPAPPEAAPYAPPPDTPTTASPAWAE